MRLCLTTQVIDTMCVLHIQTSVMCMPSARTVACKAAYCEDLIMCAVCSQASELDRNIVKTIFEAAGYAVVKEGSLDQT